MASVLMDLFLFLLGFWFLGIDNCEFEFGG